MTGIKRLSPRQSRKVNTLVKKECCNCENGNCILLDDGDTCVCPQLISYSLLCKWFRIAVLPLDIVKRKGKDYFENVFIHKFDSITTIGLLLTLVMIFSFQGNVILENPLHIVLIAIPLILQTFLIFAIAYVACRVLKLPYKIAAPAGMIGASNFFELAVAVAIALFGTTSPAALATTVGVLTEVPVMLLLVRIANKTKGRFPA